LIHFTTHQSKLKEASEKFPGRGGVQEKRVSFRGEGRREQGGGKQHNKGKKKRRGEKEP